jgi:hypothetical protein
MNEARNHLSDDKASMDWGIRPEVTKYLAAAQGSIGMSRCLNTSRLFHHLHQLMSKRCLPCLSRICMLVADWALREQQRAQILGITVCPLHTSISFGLVEALLNVFTVRIGAANVRFVRRGYAEKCGALWLKVFFAWAVQ